MNIEGLQSLLGWTALINYLLLTIWFVMYACCADWIYRLHSRWFAYRANSLLRFITVRWRCLKP